MGYKHVLLIDDDVEDHEIFKTALAKLSENLECSAFTNATEALQKLDDRELKPDLIFLDLNMPIMSGQEFLMTIKQRDTLKNIPVIIYSTSSNPTTMQLTREMGAINFITKPDRFDKLVDIFKPILNPN